jgi:hypothetical protein
MSASDRGPSPRAYQHWPWAPIDWARTPIDEHGMRVCGMAPAPAPHVVLPDQMSAVMMRLFGRTTKDGAEQPTPGAHAEDAGPRPRGGERAADRRDERHRQVAPAPVSGRASSEQPPKREPMTGVRLRVRLVNVTAMQPSGTISAAGAAPSVTGGRLHAQLNGKPGEVDEIWISAKRRQIAALEQQG